MRTLQDEVDTILAMEKAGLSKREIGLILGQRHKRETAYTESGVRFAVHKALAARAEQLYGKDGGDDE